MDIITKAKALNLPQRNFAVVGSGVLEIHGIRKAKDLDILVNEEAYKILRNRGWKRPKDAKDVVSIEQYLINESADKN